MERVLIVEDSAMIAEAIRREIFSKLQFQCDVAKNFQKAKELIDRHGSEYFITVLDLHLPDAAEGEVVDYALAKDIPSVVFTATFNDEIREKMMAENILDYVVKEGPQAVDYLMHVIQRIHKNRFIKVLVVDDSTTSRAQLTQLLKNQRFMVLEAKNGKDALTQLKHHPEVKLVITDYNMPIMDGFELITAIRREYPRDRMAIIGISAHGSGLLSAKFLKKGAGDFIVKPFVKEELQSRINQNIEMLEYIEEVRIASIIDHLTGLYNRRHFFQVGETLFENAKRCNFTMCVAVIDIDFFKKVNDTYGHYAGDMVLKSMGKLFAENLRSADILARVGGEEFCVITTNMDRSKAEVLFERLRRLVVKQKISTGKETINVSISVGVTTQLGDTLEATINHADKLLYQAKETGRNKVVVE